LHTYGSGPGPGPSTVAASTATVLRQPYATVLSPDESILYVADAALSQIVLFDVKTATYLRSIGSFGSTSGTFAIPHALAITASGDLIVSERGTSRVQLIDHSTGEFIRYLTRGAGSGYGLVHSPCGLVTHCVKPRHGGATQNLMYSGDTKVEQTKEILFVADTPNSCIQLFHVSSGKFVRQFGGYGDSLGEFDRPVDLTVSRDGRFLIVADANKVELQIFDIGIPDPGPDPCHSVSFQMHTHKSSASARPVMSISLSELLPRRRPVNDSYFLNPCGFNGVATMSSGDIFVSMPSGVFIVKAQP
jgi:DNA-binding beta-propeller fold protein YncE